MGQGGARLAPLLKRGIDAGESGILALPEASLPVRLMAGVLSLFLTLDRSLCSIRISPGCVPARGSRHPEYWA